MQMYLCLVPDSS